MYATIVIRCTRDANQATFCAGLGSVSNVAGAFPKTNFSRTPEMEALAIFGGVNATYAFLVFPIGQNGFEAHVQNVADASSISHLKESAESVASLFATCAERGKLGVEDCFIRVFAEDSLVLTARESNRWKHLRETFSEKILGHFIVALIVALVSWAAKVDVEKSIVTFLATILALIVRSSLEVLFFKKEFKYAYT